jgi:hypothetical protein
MTIAEIAILSVLIACVVVSVCLGFLQRNAQGWRKDGLAGLSVRMRTWLPVRVETLWWLRVRGLGARRHCSASLDKRFHGQVSHFPAALGRRAASRMLYCPRRKRTGARLLVAARFHSRINGLADECVEHMLYLLDLASAGFSCPVQPPMNTGPLSGIHRGQRQSRRFSHGRRLCCASVARKEGQWRRLTMRWLSWRSFALIKHAQTR